MFVSRWLNKENIYMAFILVSYTSVPILLCKYGIPEELFKPRPEHFVSLLGPF